MVSATTTFTHSHIPISSKLCFDASLVKSLLLISYGCRGSSLLAAFSEPAETESPSHVCIIRPCHQSERSIEAETAHRYCGILEQLNSDEWRRIKFYADMYTLQCDILGNLPLEMACLVAEYLPLVDIVRLRRVRDLIHFEARGKISCFLRD